MPSTADPANQGTATGHASDAGNARTITGTSASDPANSHAPPAIPGYRVVRELGRGGMGEVYEVVSEKLNVTFALKTIRPDRVSQRFLTRFLTEARTMTQLDHPHIARIYFYGETDDGPYFTMRYLPDGTLDQRMPDFQRDPHRAVKLMADLAGAVSYLHSKGFIHRDLKPHNILFVNDVPYVSDFGLAKEFGDDSERGSYDSGPMSAATVDSISQAETVDRHEDNRRLAMPTYGIVGTLPYMSPEQLLNRGEQISARTDIWALGVMLYELLTGHRPFEADDREILSELIKKEEPHPIQIGKSPADPELERIVRRCLAKNPNDRYASADLLERDLRRWLGESERPVEATNRPNWFVRHPFVSIAGLLTIAAAVFLIIHYWPRPAAADDRIAQAKQKLIEGQTATFIGEKWPTKLPLTVISGKDRAVIREGPDGSVTIEAFQPVLVQFFDDPGIDSYTFRVEIRYNGRDFGDRVGVYVGHQKFSTPDGDKHFFLPMTFNDHVRDPDAAKGLKAPPTSMQGVREVQAVLHESQAGAPGSFSPFTFQGGRRPFQTPKQNGEDEWHKLEVVARPNQWEFRFEGTPAVKVPVPIAKHVIDELQRWHKGAEPFPLTLNSRGGLGLFIFAGTASFRNAEIVPDQPPVED
jgi:serine/threonine protein kinase